MVQSMDSIILEPMVQFIIDGVVEKKESDHYWNEFNLVMILISSVPKDLDKMVRTVVERAIKVPIHFVLIGIGEADFSLMDQIERYTIETRNLGSDDVYDRKLVTFVPQTSFNS